MSDLPLLLLSLPLVLLVFASACFTSAETALMGLNRYRLRHLAKHRHKGAMRASRLLSQPDRVLGAILIGNNLVKVLAAAHATLIPLRLWGEPGIFVAALLLTLVLLVVAEVTPRTVAALHPEAIAYAACVALEWLARALQPLTWLVGGLSNALVRLLRLDVRAGSARHLSAEELRTAVRESGTFMPLQRQSMLLNVLDLEKVTINDILVPRNEVVGIDLDDSLDHIMQVLSNSQHTRLPVFRKDLNNVIGMLHTRSATRLMKMEEPNKAELLQLTRDAYFVPESTPLPVQLLNFQKQKQRIAIVVDEYGDVKGIVTLEDILEEIVGNFTTSLSEELPDIHPQGDGTYLIDGGTYVREINRALDWDLPTDGPKTLNGLLTEMLESIPASNVGVRLPWHYAEIIQVKDNTIKTVRMWALEPPKAEDAPEIQASLFD